MSSGTSSPSIHGGNDGTPCGDTPPLQLMKPECVRLNRGNHESRQQNKLMGFEEEVPPQKSTKIPGPGFVPRRRQDCGYSFRGRARLQSGALPRPGINTPGEGC